MARKKTRKDNASHWRGYSPEEKRQTEIELSGKLPEDSGFYGKRHCKRQKLF